MISPRTLRQRIPRPSNFDIALAATLLLAMLVELFGFNTGFGAGPQWVRALAAVVTGVALAWRSIFPATVAWTVSIAAVLGAAWGEPETAGMAPFLALIIAQFSLGRGHERPGANNRQLYASAIAIPVLGCISSAVRFGTDPSEWIFIGLITIAPYLCGRAVGLSALDSREQAAIAALAVQERDQAEAAAIAEERARIARELHDLISHSVSMMGVQAGAARRLAPADSDELIGMLRTIEQTSRQSLDEMRRLLGILRSDGPAGDPLGPQPGTAAIGRLADQTRSAGTPVELELDATLAGLSSGPDLAVFRIVQEALTNVRRHAPGETATVRITKIRDRVVVSVANPLPAGWEANSEPGHHGIVGMRERASLYGGHLSAERRGDQFVVDAEIPAGDPGVPEPTALVSR
jgi:signal transduction histidine kinase